MKKTIFVSIIAAIFTITGCGSSNSDKQSSNSQPLTTVSKETQALAKSILFQGRLSDNLSSSKQMTQGHSVRALTPSDARNQVEDCANGGTMTTTFLDSIDPYDPNFNPDDLNMSNFSTAIRMVYDNCLDEGVLTDGIMEFNTTVAGQKMVTSMTYLSDFTLRDGNEAFKILKGSTLLDEMVDETKFVTTETMTVFIGDEKYETNALKTVSVFDEAHNQLQFYMVSGEERLGGESYRIDESYDASKTPMVIDSNGDLRKGGKFRYIDAQNHIITLEVTEKNQVTVSIDTDGDGKVDEEETMAL